MEDTDNEFTLGRPAKDAYGSLCSKRTPVVDMARLMAELTIPSAFPPEGYETGDDLPGNNQSAAAGFVNGLASTLMFMAFPPGQPIASFKVDEHRIQPDIDADPAMYSMVLLGLARLEIAHREKLATTPIATVYTEYLKQLLIAGNALWKHLKLREPTFHRCDTYVVKRAASGKPLVTILEEVVSLQDLDDDMRYFILSRPGAADHKDLKDVDEWERTACIHSVCKLKVDASGDASWLYWEEWEGHKLPGTEVETDYDTPPMWPGWLIPVPGKNWGRSYCEEYRGDLYSLEAHWSGINDITAAQALALMFVRPGSATSLKAVREARNLSMLPGDPDDVGMFRSEKGADLNGVGTTAEQVERRLARAFLQQQAIQRSGERVTAEEIKRLGQELDKLTGGLYTQIAQGSQQIIITRAIRLNEEDDKALPELPADVVSVKVATGIDALGNSNEFDNLVEFATTGQALFPKQYEVTVSAREGLLRLASYKGVKPDGLIKTEEAMAEEGQQDMAAQMAATMLDKGTGPAINALAAGGGLPSAAPEAAAP